MIQGTMMWQQRLHQSWCCCDGGFISITLAKVGSTQKYILIYIHILTCTPKLRRLSRLSQYYCPSAAPLSQFFLTLVPSYPLPNTYTYRHYQVPSLPAVLSTRGKHVPNHRQTLCQPTQPIPQSTPTPTPTPFEHCHQPQHQPNQHQPQPQPCHHQYNCQSKCCPSRGCRPQSRETAFLYPFHHCLHLSCNLLLLLLVGFIVLIAIAKSPTFPPSSLFPIPSPFECLQ